MSRRRLDAAPTTREGSWWLLLGLPISFACALADPVGVGPDDAAAPLAAASAVELPSLALAGTPVTSEAPTPARPPAPLPIEPIPLAGSHVPALPLDAEQLARELARAEGLVAELGIRAKIRHAPVGPLPDAALLRPAYHEGRAFVLAGELDEVREWMALAKFGRAEPGAAASLGPLAHYDLVVTRDDDDAWLHVIVPPLGPQPDQLGRHEAWVEGERWINLVDLAQPGRHYLPFKSNGNESLARQWGRVDVVEQLVEIADEYRQRTGLLLGVGDLSHVGGGKILDHWTHREGVDVDLYLLDYSPGESEPSESERPRVWWHHFRKHDSIWSSEPKGKGKREARLDPEDELSDTPSSQRLRVLAQIVFPIDPVAYFVHDDPRVLSSFDREVGERRPGRRYLHAQNRGLWPRHCDHVHLRWVDGNLPVGETPRP